MQDMEDTEDMEIKVMDIQFMEGKVMVVMDMVDIVIEVITGMDMATEDMAIHMVEIMIHTTKKIKNAEKDQKALKESPQQTAKISAQEN